MTKYEEQIQGMAQPNRGSVGFQEALAQPEQIMQDSTCSTTLRLQGKPYPRTCKKCGLGPCIAQPSAQPEQEPVQFKCTVMDDAHPNGIPLAQWAKPQRTWVGLSDEEIWEAISRIGTSDSDVNPYAKLADARAIEAKLKEKNNG